MNGRIYREGERYSPFDMPGVSFTAHRGHGCVVYRGLNNGHMEFRCEGCSESVFVLPPLPLSDDDGEAAADAAERRAAFGDGGGS